MPSMDKLLNTKEAAEILGFSESRVRYEIFHKRIPIVKIGRSIRLEYADLMIWIKSKKQNIGTFK